MEIESRKVAVTKNGFVLKGIVCDLKTNKKGFGYEEGIVEKNGKPYNKIRFTIQTNEHNKIPIELFGMVKDKVYFYNPKIKQTKEIKWNDRKTVSLDGYNIIVPEYDIVEMIHNDFNDGDVVFVKGAFQFESYEDQQGIPKNITKFIIKSINKSDKEIDFNSKDFKEVNKFNQEIIINEISQEDNKLNVDTYTCDYKGIHQSTFIIDITTTAKEFIRNVKTLKLGDFVKVAGRINYCVEFVEEPDAWSSTGYKTISNVSKSLQILSVDGETIEKSRYSEEDLIQTQNMNASNITVNDELPFDLGLD